MMTPAPAVTGVGSGLRSRSEAEAVAIVEPQLRRFGVTRVAHITGLDRIGVPVHMAITPMATSLSSGSGKGRTFEASWLSATMEAIEQRYWADGPTGEPLLAPAQTLERLGLAHVPPDTLPLLTPATSSQTRTLAWVEADSVRALLDGQEGGVGERCWVPRGTVASSADLAHDRVTPSMTNGLASGFTIAEALLSALTELIERDAIAQHPVPTTHRTALAGDVRSVAPEVFDCLDRAGLELGIEDVTSDLGVPVYVAYLYPAPGEIVGVFKGAGCALDGRTALLRAVIEAIQSRTVIVAGARDDIYGSQRRAGVSGGRRGAGDWVDLPPPVNLSTGRIETDVARLIEILDAGGFDQQYAYRHTPEHESIQVVHAVVPGLEGYPMANVSVDTRARWAQWRSA